MRILVVGGAEHVGGAVTDILIDKGYNFSVWDSLLYETEYLKNCDFIFGDVRDYEKINKILKNYDCDMDRGSCWRWSVFNKPRYHK